MNVNPQLVFAIAMTLWLTEGSKPPSSLGVVSEQTVASPSTIEARDLPADDYARLKAGALANATAHVGPRIRNPRLQSGGVDPGIGAIMQEQRAYLRSPRRGVNTQQASPLRPGSVPRSFLGTLFPSASCLAPVISAVNGRATDVVFTQRLGDNHFRVEGCGFGSEPGEVRLEPDSQPASLELKIPPILLQVENSALWSDSAIDVRIDPRLSGIPDSLVRLIVRRADGYQLEFPRCRFFAVRSEPIPLKTIAGSWVTLEPTMATSRPIHEIEYLSPPVAGREVPRDAAKASAFIVRSDSDTFGGGSDFYDFSALNSGWAVESVQVQDYVIACPGDVIRSKQPADWKTHFEAHGFTVTWASNTCSSFIPPMFRFSMSSSQYGLKVWVVGPVGTEPVDGDVKKAVSHISGQARTKWRIQ